MERVLSADGVPLHVEMLGTGSPTLVFVHGWSCDHRYWHQQLPTFALDHRVVAIDLAGHGASGDDRAVWTMEAFGDDVVAVADALELDEMVLVGHSMGGDVIVAAAQRVASRVLGLVWVDAYRSLGEPRTPAEVERLLAPFRVDFATAARRFVRGMFQPTTDPALVAWVVEDMASAAPAIALAALQHAVTFEPDVIAALDQMTTPRVAINPDIPSNDTGSLARHGVQTRLMTGVDHFLMMEDAQTFNRLLAETVRGFASAPR